MQDAVIDPLRTSMSTVAHTIAQSFTGRELAWAGAVYHVLGELASVVKEQAQETRNLAKAVGEVNPEVQTVPTVERQAVKHREQQSRLSERIYVLREEVRRAESIQSGSDGKDALSLIRSRASELLKALATERRKENEFTLDAINSNPGAGE